MKERMTKLLVETGTVTSLSEAKRLVATGGARKAGDMVEKALVLAEEAHAGVVDKAGAAYFYHPEKVASLLVTHEPEEVATPEALAVAFLHDVVEDTDWTLEDLEKVFPPAVVEGVDAMTRREDESYNEYFKRFSTHPVARVVKKWDMVHNMDLTRLKTFTLEDARRTERYARTLKRLMREG